ncbi:MAG: type II toxin-antitoxin system RelE/ParE family toxin [Pirellulaceae bacterium]
MIGVRVCSAAEAEFTDALCWYAERSPDVALNFDSEFDAVLAKIAESPDRYPVCDDRHRYVLMRRFPYQVIYRTIADTVTVIAVAHTSREPGYWTDR